MRPRIRPERALEGEFGGELGGGRADLFTGDVAHTAHKEKRCALRQFSFGRRPGALLNPLTRASFILAMGSIVWTLVP
jgi:hypothetical protein